MGKPNAERLTMLATVAREVAREREVCAKIADAYSDQAAGLIRARTLTLSDGLEQRVAAEEEKLAKLRRQLAAYHQQVVQLRGQKKTLLESLRVVKSKKNGFKGSTGSLLAEVERLRAARS